MRSVGRSVLSSALALAPWLARAAAIENPIGAGATFTTTVERITNYAIIFVVPLSASMVLLAGFFYMTSGGDTEKLKTAHRTLLWALVGTGVVLLSKATILIVRSVLGLT